VKNIRKSHRQTDRQTDRRTTYCGITALCVAWRDKTASINCFPIALRTDHIYANFNSTQLNSSLLKDGSRKAKRDTGK